MAGKQIGVTLKFIDDFSQGWKSSIKALTDGSKNAQKLANQIGKVGNDISKVGKQMSMALTVPIVALGTKGVKSAMDFEKSIAKVMTLEDKLTQYGQSSSEIQAKAISDITNASKTYGKDINDVADAYYNLASAFNETKDIEKGLDVASKLARAGQITSTEAGKALAQVYNAYGGDLEHIGDVLVKTQNWGFTTIAELGDSMAKVLPDAKAMGVELEDVYAAMAVLTSSGIETSEAVTYLKNAFKQTITMGDREKIANGGLVDYIMSVNKEMDTYDKIMKSFKNIRATSGIVGLTTQTDLFKHYKKEITDSANALNTMDEKMANTNAEKMNKAINNINITLMQIGQRLLPVVDRFLTSINEKLESFQLTDAQIDGIIRVVVALASIGPVLMGVGGAIKTVSSGLKIFNTLQKGFSAISIAGGIIPALASPLGVVLAVVAGIAAVAYIVYKNFDKIKPAIDRLLQAIQPLLDILQIIGQVIFSAIGGAFNSVVQTVGNIIAGLIDSITMVFSGIGDVLYGIFTGNFDLIGQGLLSIFEGIGSNMLNVLSAPIRLILSFINGLIDGINKVSIKVPDWVPAIGGKDFGNIPKIPEFASGIDNFAGGFARINEQGGEIVDLPQGSRVIPHDVSMAMARTGQNITISLAKLADSIVVREDADIDKITSMLADKLVRAYVNS